VLGARQVRLSTKLGALSSVPIGSMPIEVIRSIGSSNTCLLEPNVGQLPVFTKKASSAYSRQNSLVLDTLTYPHFESPQFRQVLHPSIITTAAVLHFAQSWAPSGKCDFEKASVCLVRASNSARFSATSLR
jgi:hypothetical protein